MQRYEWGAASFLGVRKLLGKPAIHLCDLRLRLLECHAGLQPPIGTGGVNIYPMDFTRNGEPVRVHAAYVDAGLLPTLGVKPVLGRWISADEDVKGGPRNIVVSYPFWRDFLGSDPHVLGRVIRLSGNSYAVIGVMPQDFTLPKELADVFVSLWVAYPEAAPFRGVHFMQLANEFVWR